VSLQGLAEEKIGHPAKKTERTNRVKPSNWDEELKRSSVRKESLRRLWTAKGMSLGEKITKKENEEERDARRPGRKLSTQTIGKRALKKEKLAGKKGAFDQGAMAMRRRRGQKMESSNERKGTGLSRREVQ